MERIEEAKKVAASIAVDEYVEVRLVEWDFKRFSSPTINFQ